MSCPLKSADRKSYLCKLTVKQIQLKKQARNIQNSSLPYWLCYINCHLCRSGYLCPLHMWWKYTWSRAAAAVQGCHGKAQSQLSESICTTEMGKHCPFLHPWACCSTLTSLPLGCQLQRLVKRKWINVQKLSGECWPVASSSLGSASDDCPVNHMADGRPWKEDTSCVTKAPMW